MKTAVTNVGIAIAANVTHARATPRPRTTPARRFRLATSRVIPEPQERPAVTEACR
jgi:hypothetical protein